jgi:hypothetical protein
MRKLLFLSVFSMSVLLADAQQGDRIFNPWKVDVSLGGAIPADGGGGGLFVAEPKYAVADQFWAGLRIEGAVMGRSFPNGDGTNSTKIMGSSSYVLTGDFYFTTTDFRPFIGVGGGVYRLASGTIDDNSGGTTTIAAATKLGALVRAGFELGHFRLGAEYNLIGSSDQTLYDFNTGNTFVSSIKNSYIGIKAGIVFGGRRL